MAGIEPAPVERRSTMNRTLILSAAITALVFALLVAGLADAGPGPKQGRNLRKQFQRENQDRASGFPEEVLEERDISG